MPSDIVVQSQDEITRKAAWIGIASGLRSMMPAAALSWSSQEIAQPMKTLTGLMAVGEIIADKLPNTPSRLKTGSFVFRLSVGAVAGAMIYRRAQQSPFEGAIRGAVGAIIGTFVGYGYRLIAAQTTDIPDIIWASLEDAAAFGLSMRATDLSLAETHV